MTVEEFKALSGQYLYLDGATGSNLVRAGMPSGVCPEQWILEHPQEMLKLQTDYVKAGTEILYAPTFTANRIKLSEYGLDSRMEEMIADLVSISKQAAAAAKDRASPFCPRPVWPWAWPSRPRPFRAARWCAMWCSSRCWSMSW